MSEVRQEPSVALLLGFVRAVPAIVLAGVFTWMAFFVRGNGGRAMDWGAPAFVAFLCGVGAVTIVVRAMLKSGAASKANSKGGPAVEEEPAFDADAAIKRYLDRRGAEPIPTEASAPERAAPRPVFGRKTS